jgi:hypothetical protein
MQNYHGTCHCGTVKFRIETLLEETARCDCSLCRRRSAIMHYVPVERFEILEGEDSLTLYQRHIETAEHFFCKTCGIYPFHKPRTRPGFMGINVGCLEGVDVYAFEPIRLDGVVMD